MIRYYCCTFTKAWGSFELYFFSDHVEKTSEITKTYAEKWGRERHLYTQVVLSVFLGQVRNDSNIAL